tara:strand:+ start:750 stop:1094 length:345 start_codon:yes stop_codon:yes gene_type:complete
MKKWNEIKESMEEDFPLNVASSGAIKGLGKPPEDGPPVKKKKRKKFAGSEVFEVTEDEYMKCMHGRNKHERWSRKFDMGKLENVELRKFAQRHPGKSIVLQNERTGEMIYLRRF